LNSFQIIKIKIKKLNPIAVDVLLKAYPIVPLSCRSNLAGLYLKSVELCTFSALGEKLCIIKEFWIGFISLETVWDLSIHIQEKAIPQFVP
jgi:hypothetical protein